MQLEDGRSVTYSLPSIVSGVRPWSGQRPVRRRPQGAEGYWFVNRTLLNIPKRKLSSHWEPTSGWGLAKRRGTQWKRGNAVPDLGPARTLVCLAYREISEQRGFFLGKSGSASVPGARDSWPQLPQGLVSCRRTTSESQWPRRTARLFPSGDRLNDQICSDLKSVMG